MRLRGGTVYWVATLVAIFLYSLCCGLVVREKRGAIDFYLAERLNTTQGQIRATLYDYKRFSNYIYDEIVNTEAVTSILFAAQKTSDSERDRLRTDLYGQLESSYLVAQKYDFRQIDFHLPDATSFLRMYQPEMYGDSLKDVRVSVVLVNALRQVVSGFEEGRIHNGFRYVYPLKYANRHIGSVEISISSATVIKKMGELHTDVVGYFLIQDEIVADKVFDEQRQSYYAPSFIDGYMCDLDVNAESLRQERRLLGERASALKAKIFSRAESQLPADQPFDFLVSQDNIDYLVQFFPVDNIAGDQVAAFVIVTEEVQVSAFRHDMIWQLAAVTVIFILLGVSCLLLCKYYQRMKVARLQAERASMVKSEFLANMSHEIRTPISGIKGMLSLMEYTTLSAEQEDYLHRACHSADILLQLINDILDLSKIEAGELELECRPFCLTALLDGVMSLFLPLAAAKGVTLQCEIAEDVPDHLMGDSLKMNQIFNNLIGNALKFTDDGFISVGIACSERLNDGRVMLDFVVKDTGIGMTPDMEEKIFTPFVQGDSSTTRKYGGTGLGLSITHELICKMGGEIKVESSPMHGTQMCFSLAFCVAEAVAEPVQSSVVDKKPEGERTGSKDAQILVAEDSAVNRMVLERILQKEGYQPDTVVNGQEAVEAASRKRYDLIFMDCQMPILDGYSATQKIRQAESSGHKARIVALTAHALVGEDEKCFAAGMDGYLTKPASVSAILKEVNGLREEPRGRAETDS